MAALNNLILYKKYTTNQNQKGKCCAFKAFLLDCLENDRTRGKKTRMIAQALDHLSQHQQHWHLYKQLLVKDSSDIHRLESRSMNWFIFHQVKKIKVQYWGVEFVQHIKKRNQMYVFDLLCGTLQNCVFWQYHTKIPELVCRSLMIPDLYPDTSSKKL
jgi:N-glycosylase/DNA lyase